jgi:hypothetical protein
MAPGEVGPVRSDANAGEFIHRQQLPRRTAAYASAFSAALPAYFAWAPNSCSMRSS